MMINKRLIGTVGGSIKYIAGNAALQWCVLASNIVMIGSVCRLAEGLYLKSAGRGAFLETAVIGALAAAVRFACHVGAARMSYLSGKAVKKTLREKMYSKLLRLGSAYREQVQTGEVVQAAVEGVDQLETYFGAYRPQFLYAILAPLTLFAVLCFVNVPAALVLLACVPLIPIAIAAVQTWAKKLLGSYWDQYTALGDTSLENLQGVDLDCPGGSFTAIVGESGCGKSTVAAILMGRNRNYTGEVTIGGVPLADLSEESLLRSLTYVGHQSHLFKGTVRENLRMGCPDAGEDAMWKVLEEVRLADFLRGAQGLETRLSEKAANLSGGQRQRLALARALLHDSPVYIFDEAASNIDVESENDIMARIRVLAKTKTVILISHRLANGADADCIYVLDGGRTAEKGTHAQLLAQGGRYAALWNVQQSLENHAKEEQK